MADAELDAVRRRAFGISYRMLGSVSDAEDVAQEALLRFVRTTTRIDEPAAWITTVATRLSIDVLRDVRDRRETYVGPWLPEPLIGDATIEPGQRAELADSLSQAFLVVLERLTPVERAAFLLHEVFEYDYRQIAVIVDRTETNCRQIVTRAKKHLEASRPRFDADDHHRDRLLELFLAAADEGDLGALEALLADDAAMYSDGGGKATAARKPLFGASRIAHVVVSMAAKMTGDASLGRELVHVNGQPGVILRTPAGDVFSVLSIDVVGGRIQTLRVIRNPEKLAHL